MIKYKIDEQHVCTISHLHSAHAYQYCVDSLPVATFSEFMVEKFGFTPFCYLCNALVSMSKEEMLNLEIPVNSRELTFEERCL